VAEARELVRVDVRCAERRTFTCWKPPGGPCTGSTATSTDARRAEVGDLDGPPAAVEGVEGVDGVDDELLAARHDSVVLSSTDGGRTWRPLLER
jgi:hypothetical protein